MNASTEQKAALAVLRALIHRIDTQNSRATAQPFLHLMRVKRQQFVPHSAYGDGGWWRESLGDCDAPFVEAATEELAWLEMKAKFGYEDEEQPRLDQFDEIHWWETENVFLSEEGYKRHMELNSHNYRRNEVQDFLIFAHRNPELKELYAAIRALIKE